MGRRAGGGGVRWVVCRGGPDLDPRPQPPPQGRLEEAGLRGAGRQASSDAGCSTVCVTQQIPLTKPNSKMKLMISRR